MRVWQILHIWLAFTIRLPWVWVCVANNVWCLNCLISRDPEIDSFFVWKLGREVLNKGQTIVYQSCSLSAFFNQVDLEQKTATTFENNFLVCLSQNIAVRGILYKRNSVSLTLTNWVGLSSIRFNFPFEISNREQLQVWMCKGNSDEALDKRPAHWDHVTRS